MILSVRDARALAATCMAAVGHTREEAEIIADPLIDCELRGLSSGGLPRALSVIDRIRDTATPRRPRRKFAPRGGTEGRFSTNPIAFGFPSTTTPVIWDIGTAGVMLGEVVLKQRLGELLPEGLAFDSDARPTRDPGAALKGAFTVWGGHKGSGLAMVVQLLGMTAGQATAPASLRDCGIFILVVDPAVLTSADDFRQRVCAYAYADGVRATRPVDPGQPVRVPFDRSIVERAQRIAADAVEVPRPVYEALRRAAASPAKGEFSATPLASF